MRYKTKPFEIEAVQWKSTDSLLDVYTEFNGMCNMRNDGAVTEVYDYLQDTWVKVNLGDYIIKGNKGEFYPCDSEVFEKKYEPV